MGARIFYQFEDEPHKLKYLDFFLRMIEVCLSSLSPSRAAGELFPLIEQFCKLVFFLWNKEFRRGALAGVNNPYYEHPGAWQSTRTPNWPLFEVDYEQLKLEIPEPD
jgi:hypothetical protein